MIANAIVMASLLLTNSPDSEGTGVGDGGAGPNTGVKVAAVQVSGYDKAERPRPGFDPVPKVLEFIERAGRDGAQLIVFPEYYLGHIAVPGSETDRIAEAARAQSIHVIIGCWEALPDQAFANTALVFGRDGRIVGKYRKVHAAVDTFEGEPPWSRPPGGKTREWFLENDPEWIMERGAGFPVFQLDFGTVGILTCYDGWFPESFRCLSLNGAELLVWINGRQGRVEDFIARAAMFQNEVALVATNQAYGAGTLIGQWPSAILSHVENPGESYIAAEIDLERIRQARANSRNTRQRRPDVYETIIQSRSAP